MHFLPQFCEFSFISHAFYVIKSKEFNGSVFVVFTSDDKARDFVDKSKQTPIKYDNSNVLECSLQDDYYKKKILELATGGKSMDNDSKNKEKFDKQIRKEKRKVELQKKTNEHLEKLNNENLSGAVIHLAGRKFKKCCLFVSFGFFLLVFLENNYFLS